MPKFRPSQPLTPAAIAFVEAADDRPREPKAKVQVVFRLAPDTRSAITRLAAQRTLDTGRRVAEQALFEEAIGLLLAKYRE